MATEEEFSLIESDPSRPSLTSIADAGHAFSIPWSREVAPLFATLNSSRLALPEGPWMISSPFDGSDLKGKAMLQDTSAGNATFRDGMSASIGSSTDHLSAALGITIGYPFLNASVTGQYDRDVTENSNAIRASRNSSCRCGRVIANEAPALSADARNLLRKQGGLEEFYNLFGDFYVCGYELGADAGATLSAATHSSKSVETLTLTVTVRVLFFEESLTISKTISEESQSYSMTFTGFNTIESTATSTTSQSLSLAEQTRMQNTATAYLKTVGSIDEQVRTKLAHLGLKDGQELALSQCGEVCRSGLVVQLLLAPISRLNEFVSLLKK